MTDIVITRTGTEEEHRRAKDLARSWQAGFVTGESKLDTMRLARALSEVMPSEFEHWTAALDQAEQVREEYLRLSHREQERAAKRRRKRVPRMPHECMEESAVLITGKCLFCEEPHDPQKPKGGHASPWCEERRQARIDQLQEIGIEATR